MLFLQLALDIFYRLEKLPQAQVLLIASSENVSELSFEGLPVLLNFTKLILDYMNQRVRVLIDYPNLIEYLDLVKVLLKFIVNGLVNFDLAYQKSLEEIYKTLKKSKKLELIFQFISDFLTNFVTLFFYETKYTIPLMLAIQIAASIPSEFPQCAESFLIDRFSKIFMDAINVCKNSDWVCNIAYYSFLVK